MQAYSIQPKRRPGIAGQIGPVQFYVYNGDALVTVFRRRADAQAFVTRAAQSIPEGHMPSDDVLMAALGPCDK